MRFRVSRSASATIEALGPLTLFGSDEHTTHRLALAGVALLGLPQDGGGHFDPMGFAFAAAAGVAWAGYILASARTAVDGTCSGWASQVGLMSSVIPYSLELMSLRRLPPAVFAVLTCLSPVTAALAGLVVLGQQIGVLGYLGVTLVTVASIGAVRSAPSGPAGPALTG